MTGRITAVLGPTNTGKTHMAIQQMLEYRTGCIGFPLRLLARENYDRVVKEKGKGIVALVTGEEKIVPKDARYFLCTVESMPVDQPFDFIGVDEIQLCADPDRGHVFTDRLLRARGAAETVFMGAETARNLIRLLVPGVDFVTRTRLSQLTFSGFKKLTRLPKRSAVVAFSIDDVYSFAELVRRQRGGTAVVLGALSPRTRNHQVDMYQNGEVDFLVATDAIGMGLNMDIHHVALAATRKFDGQKMRPLTRAEMAQIAGRAGRYKRDGTFGVTGPVTGLDADAIEAIESHQFENLKQFYWRNSELDFSTPIALVHSLERPPDHPVLARGRPSDDYVTLAALASRDEIMARADGKNAVRLLWEVCQIPDFRRTMTETHQELVAGVFEDLVDRGRIPSDRVARQIERLDKTEGDVDTLMARIAHIRTWTYITHKSGWLDDADAWAEQAREVEDRLSDALHEGLTRRFVDRRSAILLRAIEQGGELLAGIRANGEVVVEGQEVGKLEGFRFVPDEQASGQDYRAVMTAARNALKPEIRRRLRQMLNAEAKQFRLNDEGTILYQQDATNPLPGVPVAKIRKGDSLLKPGVELVDSDVLDGQDRDAVAGKVREWLATHVATVLEPLTALEAQEGEGVDGNVRGISFQLHESLGIRQRSELESLIAGLDAEGRKALRARKVRLGPVLVFIPDLNKPAAVRLRAMLWNLWHGAALPAKTPADGMTSVKVENADANYYRAIGYPVYGPRAIRVDMLDRLISAIYDNAKDGQFQAKHQMAEWLGCPITDLYAVLEAMGHTKTHDPAEAKPVEDKPETVPVADVAETAPEQPAATAEPVVETVTAPAESMVEEAAPVEKPEPAADAGEAPTEPSETVSDTPTQVVAKVAPVRPELATFRLRRGKAYGGQRPHGNREQGNRGGHQRPAGTSHTGKPAEDRSYKGRKTGQAEGDGEKRAFGKPGKSFNDGKRSDKSGDRSDRGARSFGGRDQGKGKRDERGREDRIFAAAPSKAVVDSPFAVLKQLKVNDKE